EMMLGPSNSVAIAMPGSRAATMLAHHPPEFGEAVISHLVFNWGHQQILPPSAAYLEIDESSETFDPYDQI
ncbi:hypothetical protein CRG98_041845, partial [Punica granatum]